MTLHSLLLSLFWCLVFCFDTWHSLFESNNTQNNLSFVIIIPCIARSVYHRYVPSRYAMWRLPLWMLSILFTCLKSVWKAQKCCSICTCVCVSENMHTFYFCSSCCCCKCLFTLISVYYCTAGKWPHQDR